jgi:hypothetical protein
MYARLGVFSHAHLLKALSIGLKEGGQICDGLEVQGERPKGEVRHVCIT